MFNSWTLVTIDQRFFCHRNIFERKIDIPADRCLIFRSMASIVVAKSLQMLYAMSVKLLEKYRILLVDNLLVETLPTKI